MFHFSIFEFVIIKKQELETDLNIWITLWITKQHPSRKAMFLKLGIKCLCSNKCILLDHMCQKNAYMAITLTSRICECHLVHDVAPQPKFSSKNRENLNVVEIEKVLKISFKIQPLKLNNSWFWIQKT